MAGFLPAMMTFSPALADSEVINSFDSNLTVNADASVQVVESIEYNFGTNQRHGIFRDIPLSSEGAQIEITNVRVYDDKNQPYPFTTSRNNNILDIKIGDPNVLITGDHYYLINYLVLGAVKEYSDHDELYWNVTGNQWQVPINLAEASVQVPDKTNTPAQVACYTGVSGSTQQACTSSTSDDGEHQLAQFRSNQPLNPGEGLTVVTGFPLGNIINSYTPPPSPSDQTNHRAFVLSISALIAIVAVIIRSKFKPRKSFSLPGQLRGLPIVVQYDAPDNLPPIEVGTLLDRQVDISDISSVIMDLAVRGYIKIRATTRQIRFWPDKKDFELVKLADGSNLVHPAEKLVFGFLFINGDSVTLTDLQNTKQAFRSLIYNIKSQTLTHMTQEGYFKPKTNRLTKLSSIFGGALVAAYIFFRAFSSFVSVLVSESVFVFCISLVVVWIILAILDGEKLTPQGLASAVKALGFKQFLELTEKDKLDLLNAPELNPETFEKFLPYAVALGVEEKWAKKFETVYANARPVWYEDPLASGYSSMVMARSMRNFDGSFNRVFNVTAPHSSGLGGGGFSGGGFGGGGGGSW